MSTPHRIQVACCVVLMLATLGFVATGGLALAETRASFRLWLYEQVEAVRGAGGDSRALPGAQAYARQRFGLRRYEPGAGWRDLADSPRPGRAVLLVHGLDEPGGIWRELAPALHAQGHAVMQIEYPNDQPIDASAAFLLAQLRELRAAGVERVDLVTHSMGGLVARDALTREQGYGGAAAGHAELPDVARLVMVAPPNHGSRWASLRGLLEVREQAAAMLDGRWQPEELVVHGRGEAGDDLLPGSAYLGRLNGRALPRGLDMTIIAGRWLPERVLGRRVDPRLRDALGDGVVSLASTRLSGAGRRVRHVVLAGNHRGLLTGVGGVGGAAAVPAVVDHLAAPRRR